MGLDCCSAGAGSSTFSGAQAAAGAKTILSTSGEQPLGFTFVQRDTDGYFDLSSDSTTCTVPFDGVYSGIVALDWRVLGDNTRKDVCLAFPTFNGGESINGDTRYMVQLPSDAHTNISLPFERRMNAGSKVGCNVDLITGSTSFSATLNATLYIEFLGNDSP